MKKTLVIATIASLLAGCGGGAGGGSTPSSITPVAPVQPTSTTAPGITVPVAGDPRGTASLVATASVSADTLPASLRPTSSVQHRLSDLRKTRGLNIQLVKVDGTLYQSTASTVKITNSITVAPVNGNVTVNMPFSNVVPTNNDWVILSFTAIAPDGSQFFLGNLGSLVNISSSSATTASMDAASTRRLSAVLRGVTAGFISSYDLEQTPTLDSDIGTLTSSFTADAATGLYSGSTLVAISNAMQQKYGRTITIAAGTPAVVSVAPDFTKTDEVDLAANSAYFYANISNPGTTAGTVAINSPYGMPYGGTSTLNQTPSAGVMHAAPYYANAYMFSAPSGSLTLPVYGGSIIVGAHAVSTAANGAVSLPAQGGTVAVAGRAPGTSTTTVPLSSTAITVTVADPQSIGLYYVTPAPKPSSSAAAFTPAPAASTSPYPSSFYAQSLLTNSSGQISLSSSCVGVGNCYGIVTTSTYSYTQSVPTATPTAVPSGSPSPSPAPTGTPATITTTSYTQYTYAPYGQFPAQVISTGANGVTYSVDIWNPFGLTASQLGVCTTLGGGGCKSLSSNSTITSVGSFYDYGTNVGYYKWAGSGAAGDATTSVTQNYSSYGYWTNGYTLAYSGLSGTFGTTTPSALYANPNVTISTTAPVGTTWKMTVVDSNGTSYTSTAAAECLVPSSGYNYCSVTTSSSSVFQFPIPTTYATFTFPAITSPIATKSITFSYTLPASTATPGNFLLTYL